jgi:hypothetical protein
MVAWNAMSVQEAVLTGARLSCDLETDLGTVSDCAGAGSCSATELISSDWQVWAWMNAKGGREEKARLLARRSSRPSYHTHDAVGAVKA